MIQKLKTALMLAALVSVGAQAPAHATADKKAAAPAKKAAAPAAAKSGAAAHKGQQAQKPVAGKTAGKQAAPMAAANKKVPALAAKAPAKPAPKMAAHEVVKPLARKAIIQYDDPAKLAIHSASALVVDQSSGHALVEKQPDAVTPIASISKLMTAMVVLDAKQDLQEVISIGDEDVDSLKGTRSRLPVGTTMTRETAMLLALMSSENRAAHALGRHYPGGLQAFVHAMNRKAQALGMVNSRFEEPTGLSSNNVSTAHDLARMVSAAARYPEIRQYSTTAEARIELNGRVRDFHNTNALVRSEDWEIGVSKTGYISEAGRCLVMQARVADKPVVIVLLDSNGKMTRVGDAIRIKRWMESASLGQGARRA